MLKLVYARLRMGTVYVNNKIFVSGIRVEGTYAGYYKTIGKCKKALFNIFFI
jgi:hypothetical protein